MIYVMAPDKESAGKCDADILQKTKLAPLK